jgi:hypothetical protein
MFISFSGSNLGRVNIDACERLLNSGVRSSTLAFILSGHTNCARSRGAI